MPSRLSRSGQPKAWNRSRSAVLDGKAAGYNLGNDDTPIRFIWGWSGPLYFGIRVGRAER